MRATLHGHVIADSESTLEVDGYRYFPRATVRMDWLVASPRTASDLQCPHGVQFYDVVEGTACSRRAAWSYEKPGAAMKKVDHWFGFWDDVKID